MTDILLSARNLSVRFGGVLAVNNVSFDVHKGEVFTLIGPNGAGKTTVFNLISRIYEPTAGEIDYQGKKLTDQPAHAIASLGIARTFQNIELFANLTVIDNLMLGRHQHIRYGTLSALAWLGKARKQELIHRRAVEEIVDFLGLAAWRAMPVGLLPYGVQKRVELGRALAMEPRLPRATGAPHARSSHIGSSTCCSKCATRATSVSRFSSGVSTCGTPQRWATVKFQVGARDDPGEYQLGET